MRALPGAFCGCADAFNVFARLVEMGVELVYPIHHKLDIPMQLPQSGANGTGLLAHPCIFEDCAHRV